MTTRPFEQELAQSYDSRALQYRRDDEIEARSANHQRLGGNLRRICRSFPHPIRVLEIGCGTGRYFHWLDNVALLVGTDISEKMLEQARHPLLAHEITAREIRLIRGSVFEMDFGEAAFDFIYSLGVFGYGAGVTEGLCRSLHRWLGPGGWLYFDAIEVPHCATRKDRIKEMLYPRLPDAVRRWLDRRQRVPVIRHSRDAVQQMMQAAGFTDFVLASNACHSPLWNGVHLECSACKSAGVRRVSGMQLEFTRAA